MHVSPGLRETPLEPSLESAEWEPEKDAFFPDINTTAPIPFKAPIL